ncbi:MAG: hypothetical protein AAF492_18970 [Verrucomicrobiota bacterium]
MSNANTTTFRDQDTTELLLLYVNLFYHYTGQMTDIDSLEYGIDVSSQTSICFSQIIDGDSKLALSSWLPETLVLLMGSWMLAEPCEAIDNEILLVVSESFKVILENACDQAGMDYARITNSFQRCPVPPSTRQSKSETSIAVKMNTRDTSFKLLFQLEQQT